MTTTGGGEGGGTGGGATGGGQGGETAVDPNSQEVLIAQQMLPPGLRIFTFNQLEAVRVLSQANPALLSGLTQAVLNEAAAFILNNQEAELAQRAATIPAGYGFGLTPRASNVFTVENLPTDKPEDLFESNGAVYTRQGNQTFRIASQDEIARGDAIILYDDKGRGYYAKEVFGTTGKFMTDAEKQALLQQQYVTEASEQIDPETGQPILLTPGTLVAAMYSVMLLQLVPRVWVSNLATSLPLQATKILLMLLLVLLAMAKEPLARLSARAKTRSFKRLPMLKAC